MKAIILAALLLGGCSTLSNVTATAIGMSSGGPVAICNKTTLDESVGIKVELAYKAFRLVVETGVDAGFIKGTKATKLRNINRTLYNVTLVSQAGYRTCNATSYYGAIQESKILLANGYKVLGE